MKDSVFGVYSLGFRVRGHKMFFAGACCCGANFSVSETPLKDCTAPHRKGLYRDNGKESKKKKTFHF